MTIQSILVSIDPSEAGRERLNFALDLATQHGAHVLGYYAAPTVGMTIEGSPEEIAEALHEEFNRQLGLRRLDGGWVLGEKPLVEDVTTEIRYVDLAIVGLGLPEGGEPEPQGFHMADIVRSAGRPILGMPISRLSPPPFKSVIIAWDGSAGASRAVHDALPLLGVEATIRIVALGSHGFARAERLRAHLALHGLDTIIDTTSSIEADVGSELLDRAGLFEADLLIAGAYGHSKVGEDIFGGPSNVLLHQMLVPVLLSH